MQSATKVKVATTYQTPALRKLNSEEAKQFLVHHAQIGDASAKEILDLVLPQDHKRER